MSFIALTLAVAVRTLGPTAGRAPLDCAYASGAIGELSSFNHCAWNDTNGQIHFSRQRLKRMRVGPIASWLARRIVALIEACARLNLGRRG